MEGIEGESGRLLWKRGSNGRAVIRVGIDERENDSIVLTLQVQSKGVSYRRQPGARSDPLLEVEKVKLVWIRGEESRKRRAHREEKCSKGKESGAAQRGKSAAERRTVRRTEKRSRAAHGQENRKAQQERGVAERRSGEPSRC